MDRHVQTLLITSSESGSGKSTISANLSIAYAQQGKKTVLIDCDLRKPTVHRAFYVNGFVGLSSVLMDQLNVIEACQKTKIENLSVLASGVVPPNPNDLLGSKKMKLILEHLKKEFDMIIIDTPPITLFSDSMLLAPRTDGIVLVTRFGRSKKAEIKLALEKIALTQVPVIGTILNGVVKKRRDSNYDNYHNVRKEEKDGEAYVDYA
ncbi:CpsD/CapB family tyrosine-protein kinase [Listeria aquatica]|uniref:CpsD/CapB family tyrosine-protein kinase n=1 Tax=Listeria aquatica TaxID=1494960 RepID=UPI003F6FA131